ncbi:TackOD1 domain-containing metal-binding protein [Natronococcus jeotgali]|uniref:TackOD1 domain-containing metal-binding protein n=1 Tax=Natronococcus jeotgali TaxID=413812 RepID=UPI000677C969|nr:hypothetical protein [Natronococcus jeotgali]
MVSPGELRLLERLVNADTFEPEIADSGAVSYSTAGQYLDDTDDAPVTVLERFATRGVLADEFISKVYSCPECTTEGLQYTTVCPACHDPHAVETEVIEHACGYVGPESEFDADDGYRCPDCDDELTSVDIEKQLRYVCKECSEQFQTPADRLWCRECAARMPPREATENVLYRYRLTRDGKQWLDRQKQARQQIVELFEERHLETTVDTTVATEDDATRAVHVLAEDSLMGERRVVAIHDTPALETVDPFCAFAEAADAHPVVITTSGAVEAAVATRATETELTVLALTEQGTLEAEYETVDEVRPPTDGLFQRLSAVLEIPGRR